MTLALLLPKQLCKQKNQPEVNLYVLKSFYLESTNLCRIFVLCFWWVSVWACAVTAVFLKDSTEHSLFRMLVGYSLSSVDPPKALPVSTSHTCEFVSHMQITAWGSVLSFLVQTPLSSSHWNNDSGIKLLSLWQTPLANTQTGQAGITMKGRIFFP